MYAGIWDSGKQSGTSIWVMINPQQWVDTDSVKGSVLTAGGLECAIQSFTHPTHKIGTLMLPS